MRACLATLLIVALRLTAVVQSYPHAAFLRRIQRTFREFQQRL